MVDETSKEQLAEILVRVRGGAREGRWEEVYEVMMEAAMVHAVEGGSVAMWDRVMVGTGVVGMVGERRRELAKLAKGAVKLMEGEGEEEVVDMEKYRAALDSGVGECRGEGDERADR